MSILLWVVLQVASAPPLVDVTAIDSRWGIDIKYATTDNFVHKRLYPVARCVVLAPVAQQLKKAQAYLDQNHGGFRLLFKDCYRPLSVQKQMWEVVKGTPQRKYVADPKRGSIHNYGAAVDLTLADAAGAEVDMGTPYDSFTKRAQPRYEARFLRTGALTQKQVRMRRILRKAMKHGGFRGLRNEWWHFDGIPRRILKKHHRILDIPLDQIAPSAP